MGDTPGTLFRSLMYHININIRSININIVWITQVGLNFVMRHKGIFVACDTNWSYVYMGDTPGTHMIVLPISYVS